MNIIAIYDIIGLSALILAALMVIISKKKSDFFKGKKIVFLGLILFLSFYGISLFLEWSNITLSLEKVEDITGAIIPMWWIIMFYSCTQSISNIDLTKSEKKYRQFIEGTTNIVTQVDSDGKITFLNQKASILFEKPITECIGKIAYNFTHPDDHEQTKSKIDLCITNKVNNTIIENRQVSETGKVHHVRWTINLNYNDKNELISINSIGQDITERVSHEQERERLFKTIEASNDELQSLLTVLKNKNHEMESFMYATSHDLRSPLINIIGFSGELAESCCELKSKIFNLNLSTEQKSDFIQILETDIPTSLSYIENAAKHIDLMQKAMINISRMNKDTLEISQINMNSLMQSVIDGLRFEIEKNNIDISIDELPDCLGDDKKLHYILTNVLDNSIKYTSPDRPSKIKINGSKQNNKSTYCIEDNGIGFEPRHAKTIFTLFHRLNPRGKVAGDGVGLTIAQRLLERQKGEIWAESKPNKGSKFYISLPFEIKPA